MAVFRWFGGRGEARNVDRGQASAAHAAAASTASSALVNPPVAAAARRGLSCRVGFPTPIQSEELANVECHAGRRPPS